MNVAGLVKQVKTKKLPAVFLFSYAFFWVFMFLDIYTTLLVIQGDFSLEGNQIAVLWYEITGVWSPVEIIIWPVVVVLAAYIFGLKSNFLALWYLNWVAFNHVLGWLTWTQLSDYVFLLQSYFLGIVGIDFVYARPVSVIAIFFGFLFTLIQVFCFKYTKRQ